MFQATYQTPETHLLKLYSETYRFSGVYRIQEKGIIPDVLGCCIAGGERSADSGNATFGNAYEGHPGHVPDLQY